MHQRVCAGPLVRILLLACWVAGVADPVQRDAGRSWDIDGFWAMDMGQLASYWYTNANKSLERENLWILRTFVNGGVRTQFKDFLTVNAGIEGRMWSNTYPHDMIFGPGGTNVPAMQYSFYLHRADALYRLRKPLDAELQVGYFPYKYNPQSRNLGEYLFRSGTYPAYLLGEFDFAQSRVAGVRVGLGLLGGRLRQDLLATFETTLQPFYDLTGTYIATVNMPSFLTVGVGAQIRGMIPVNDSLESPEVANNQYVVNGDTGYYTFRGSKLMARLCIDPKRIVRPSGDLRIFGEEDLKFYAEAAILGVKNYPSDSFTNQFGYDNLAEKAPVTVGLNLPGFRIVDVAAVEIEWYGCRYTNSYQQVALYGWPVPVPYSLERGLTENDYENGQIYWSVHVKKSMVHGLSVTAQFARDHIRHLVQFADNIDRQQALRKEGNWWWILRVGYSF